MISVASVVTVMKLEVAARTVGTNDVGYFGAFAQAVRDVGPVGIYGHDLPRLPVVYNHGPLTGWLLVAINWVLDQHVLSFEFLIRAPACLADFATVLIVFELVRLARPPRPAAIAAVLVACSPVLFVISGFHGNTDPVFVMFSLLGVYLLVVRRWALAAGVALGIALSIKLVPIVLLPVLLVVLVRLGWRRLAAFTGGGAIVFLLLWVPVLLSHWHSFREQVLSYNGSALREWGVPQFLAWADLSGAGSWLAGPGRFGILLVSGLTAAAVAWRRPDGVVPAAGLSFVLFLLLSPAFGMQYLVWPLAAAYLIDTAAATAYNVAASIFVVIVYSDWSNAYPWHWYAAWAVPFSSGELVLMTLTWVALAAVALMGLRLLRGGIADATTTADETRRWSFTTVRA